MTGEELAREISKAIGLRLDYKLTSAAFQARINKLIKDNPEAYEEIRENYAGSPALDN